jgi:uncharacterized protein YegL
MSLKPLSFSAPAPERSARAGTLKRLVRPIAAAIALIALVLSALTAPERAPVAAQSDLLAYTMVDQWPQRDNAAQGLFQSPSDLDVARDGRVYIADPGIGGVHTLLPSGTFTTPFGVTGGFPAQLGQVGPIAIGPGPLPGGGPIMPFGPERLYVLDSAVERVVIYDLDGTYLGQWPKVNAQSIAASGDGRVYVLDRDTSEVRALDAVSGQEKFKFGIRGSDDGQFTSFTDVDVAADGRVLAVGDKRGQRVQLFDLATDEQIADPAMPAAPAKLRTVYDLTGAKYTQNGETCDASRINALGGDKVFVGQAAGACIIDSRTVTFAIAASANKGAICRDTVTLPRHRAMTQQYYALAVNDPNAGKCGEKRADLDTTPIIVKYDDEALKQVNTVWEAASNENSDNPLLFAPEAISFPQPGVMYIADASSQLRFFSAAGEQIATAERTSQSGGMSGDFEFFFIIRGDGSDVLGEVFGYYINGKRKGQDFTVEGGIGRFKTVEKRTQTGIERVIEPIWTDPLISSFEQIEVPALAWNPVSGELLVVRNDTIAQQRTQDVSIVRYAPDGREIKPAFDLPDDGKSNPYVDLVVAPDGRILTLDDLNDKVRIYQPDGTHIIDVPVAFDARAVAGGPLSPDGSVFALREPGSIERYADDGTITSRLDGRPLPFSDPVTLTDIAVDAAGRVYVSDGQSSLISVFEPSSDQDEIPIPNDAECLFQGKTTLSPGQINLGQATTVQLKLEGRCGINEEPADIVVVIPYYRRLDAGVDPSAALVTEMTQLMSRVNFAKHRVGVVSFWNTTTVELPLTSDRDAYMAKVHDITRFDPPSDQVKPQLKDALEEAGELFDASATGRRKVIVMLRVEYCTPETEFFPGQCTGVKPAEDTALALRQSGANLVVVNSFGAFDLASSDEDALFGVEMVHRRMVRYSQPAALASGVTLTHAVPAGMTVDAASITGGGTWAAPNITWDVASVDFDGMAGSAALAPTAAGRWPVAASIVANLTDGWGNPHSVSFPIPEVEVIGPTATPVTPTATATAVPPTRTPDPTATPTATATATPEPQAIHLPWLGNNECFAVKGRFDIALVVDVSSSMQGEKIAAARDSLGVFLGAVNLRPGFDHVALVDFATDARVQQDLTSNRDALNAAIAALATRNGTYIDRGLGAAMDVLAGPNARPTASKVIVLMSDGQQTGGAASALAAGEAARARGHLVYTIGFGADADGATLTAIAGDPTRYYFAPTPEQLDAVYRQIAASIPGCP